MAREVNVRTRVSVAIVVAFVLAGLSPDVFHAQDARRVPRPPAQQPGAPPAGSVAPDGYAPIPEWAGQTRAPRPASTAAYDVETVATGIANGFGFQFLPDRRILLTERPGRLRIIDASGRLSNPIPGLPVVAGGGPQ